MRDEDMEASSHIGAAAKPLPMDWIPTDPQEYTTTKHFENRAESEDRVITRGLAAEVITRCGYPEQGRGNWYFVADTQGLRIFVFCVIYKDFYPAVNTGFAEIVDMEQALKSDRWTLRQLLAEHVRTQLYANEKPWTHELEVMGWEKPIHVKGHPLVSDEGERAVHCCECDEEHESWRELKETPGQGYY